MAWVSAHNLFDSTDDDLPPPGPLPPDPWFEWLYAATLPRAAARNARPAARRKPGAKKRPRVENSATGR